MDEKSTAFGGKLENGVGRTARVLTEGFTLLLVST